MRYCVDNEGNVYQLQRCPFCGKDSTIIISQADLWEDFSTNSDRFTVCCSIDERGCGATCGFHGSVEEAVSRWNTRVVI